MRLKDRCDSCGQNLGANHKCPPIMNLAGQRFGCLVAIEEVLGERIRGCRVWLCVCDCGTEKKTSSNMLKTGHAKSCGCLNIKSQKETHIKHGMCNSATWHSWKDMKARCTNPKLRNYPRYGGRGITFCERWLDFKTFHADMGECPEGLTLERINVNGNYEPGNCRWATRGEQARNTTRNRFVQIGEETKTVIEWAREYGKSRSSIRYRLNRGIDPRVAVIGAASACPSERGAA